MLLIAVLVCAPLADALACASEASAPHAAVVDGDGSTEACDEAGAADSAHAHCVHNHCHHSTASVTGGVAAIFDATARARLLSFDDGRRFADVSDGLMRPPRA